MPILHWLNKNQAIKTVSQCAYRLLEEVPALSYGDPDNRNMLIQGDNLEALKALIPFYAGQVKCIYIDPPYNTRSAFSHYDDNLEHSIWLSMMYRKQQIVCSRSFSRKLTEYRELSAALAEFGTRAAEKLRKQHSVTGCITVFIRTNPFNPNEPQYQRAASAKLDTGTQDTRVIIATANRLLEAIYKEGYGYHKCGVQLSHIQPETAPGQVDLFDSADDCLPTENRELMKAIDRINRRYPKAVSIAATGFDRSWKPKADRISKRYTTDWGELLGVKIG